MKSKENENNGVLLQIFGGLIGLGLVLLLLGGIAKNEARFPTTYPAADSSSSAVIHAVEP